jgi:hypothetical protein
MEFDVFISHSSKDKTMADAVCARLESAGIRCWIAPRDIKAGMTWSGEIVKAIDKCRVMVLVFSANANESPQIIREVEAAVNRNKPILPLRIENILPSDSMAYFMSAVHWLDAVSEPIEEHLDQLTEAVHALLGVESAPRTERKPRPAPVFDWKPVIYATAAVVVILGLAALGFFMGLFHPGGTIQIVNPPAPLNRPATNVVITPPAVPYVPPANGADSVDAAMTGTWHLPTHFLDYDGVVTLSFTQGGTYRMETVLSDSGTYSSGAGQWTTTSSGSGFVRQGTYEYAGGHTVKITGPLGIAFYSPEMPQTPLNAANPVILGTWLSTTHPRNSPPWQMTLTNQPDGTYSFKIDIVDEGSFRSGNGALTMRSRILGTTTQGSYRSTGQDAMEFTGPLGTANWSRN